MDNEDPRMFVDQDGNLGLAANGQVTKPRGGRRPRPVMDLTTGQRWRSLSDAARELGVTRQSVMSAVARGYRCCGHQLVYGDTAHGEKVAQ